MIRFSILRRIVRSRFQKVVDAEGAQQTFGMSANALGKRPPLFRAGAGTLRDVD
jgi:hypothetical protein